MDDTRSCRKPEQSSLQLLTDWADSIGVSRRTALHWAATGQLPAVRIGRRWFVDGEGLACLVEARRAATRGQERG